MLLRFNLKDLTNDLKNEYIRLGCPLNNCSLAELIQRVEIELSRNTVFRIMTLRCLSKFSVLHYFHKYANMNYIMPAKLAILTHCMIINYFQKRTVSSIIINNHIIHLGPGDGQTMIESGGIVKPMPAPAPGASWVVDKNSAGIPYVTDGTTKKWCMSYFQVTPKEPGASSSLGELPSLEVDGDNGPPRNNTPAPIAALPGKLTFLVNVVYIFRFNVFCFFDDLRVRF